jgi:hypothetical protein
MGDADPPAGTTLHDDLMKEYYKIVDLVSDFDHRLLTIKGWGVTLSLASLGFGFQQAHYGLFLVAALSGIAFWLVEATTKLHQMRFYPRMGDIEAAAFELYRVESPDGPVTSPLIDWGWFTARPRVRPIRTSRARHFLRGSHLTRWAANRLGVRDADRLDDIKSPHRPERWPDIGTRRMQPLLFPHVMFPHVVAVVAGTALFVWGVTGHLGDP